MAWIQNSVNNQIAGSTSGSFPAAGLVGEILQAVISSSNAVNLPTQTVINVVTLNLTPGNWMVNGNCYTTATVGIGNVNYNLSLTSGGLGDPSVRTGQNQTASQLANGGGSVMPIYVSVTVNTPVYLVCYGVINSGTANACGQIIAERKP